MWRMEPDQAELKAVMAQKPRADGWTARRRALFFAALTITCNVKASCAVVKMSVSGAYRRRGFDPSFRRDWRRAIDQGYARLETEALERALLGEHCVRGALEGSAEAAEALAVLAKAPDQMAALLLRLHRERALAIEEEDAPGGDSGARERIEAKLAALRARIEAADA